jgi:hypothetical protein
MSDQVAAQTLVQTLLAALGADFTVPPVDLSGSEYQLPTSVGNVFYETIDAVSIDQLTDGTVGGTGAFDKMMSSHRAHLKDQYDKGLITGDQYTKAYIELSTAALSAAVQILLGSDQARWQALLVQAQGRRAQIDAVKAAVELEIAKYQLAAQQSQAELLKSQDVLVKLQIATEDAKYNLTHEQMHLVQEQREAARAQTSDTLVDGVTPVAGNLGKQKELHQQQIDSYKRDAEQKVAKMYLDGWITQKTLDEGLLAPTQLTNTEIEAVLSAVRTSHGLTPPAP